jgi:wyosine [tRNA(Phe)-imidazoG37] synthetase (radical SAM superfamily)
MIAFGPVPSRRLGRSLGINNIPPKACSYSCVYCQVGPTAVTETAPRAFYPPEEILRSVEDRLNLLARRGEGVDWLTFVPEGEPTLDARLGETIDLLRPLGVPIAIITNSSLLWREDVRAALQKANWLSVKVDATDPDLWRRVNRPDAHLSLDAILTGISRLAAGYRGTFTTETMLVAGVNDSPDAIGAVADYLETLSPSVAWLAIPTRPPAETWVSPPDDATLARACQSLSARLPRVEYLIAYEGDAFASSGRVEDDILAVAAVHPLREEALHALLAKAGAEWQVVERLMAEGVLRLVEYQGHRFYQRTLPRAHRHGAGGPTSGRSRP